MIVDTYTYSEAPEDVVIYGEILSWSPETFPPPDMLPKLGAIVWEGDELVCFVCADMSNSIPRAFIDYLQTNPAFSPSKRHKAVKLAERFLVERLKAHGYTKIFGISVHAGVASISTAMGYQVHDRAVLAFAKEI
jgi:hypothetical protein